MNKRNRRVALLVVALLLLLGAGAFLWAPGDTPPATGKTTVKKPTLGDEIPEDVTRRQARTAFSGGPQKDEKIKSLRDELAERSKGGPLKAMSDADWLAVSELYPEQMQNVAGCVALTNRDLRFCQKAKSPRPFCTDVIIISAYLLSKDDLEGLKRIWPQSLHADFERFFKKSKAACQGLKERGPLYLMCMLNAGAPEDLKDPDSAEFTSPFKNDSPELKDMRDGRAVAKLPAEYRNKLDVLKKAVSGNEAICKELF